MMTLEQIRAEAMALPPDERAMLGEELLIGPQSEEELGDIERAWDEEIARRVADVESGKATLISHEEVMKELDQLVRL
jgi:putative addiction module component (TIGR02574 family)